MSVFGWIARRLQPGQEERERVGERERYRAWLENREPGQSFPRDRMQAEADARRERHPDMLRRRAVERDDALEAVAWAEREAYFVGSPGQIEGRPMTHREAVRWDMKRKRQELEEAILREIDWFVGKGIQRDHAEDMVRTGGGEDKGAVARLSAEFHALERELAALDAAETAGAEPAPESEPTQVVGPEAKVSGVVGEVAQARRARGIWHYETPAEVAADQRWAEAAERAGVTAEGAREWEPVAAEPTAAAEPRGVERGPLTAAEEALALEFMLDEPTRDEEAEAPTPEAVPDFEHEAQEASGTRWPYGLVPAPPKAALLAPVDDKAELRRRAREEQAERERAAAEAYQKNLDGLKEMGLSARAGETPGAEHDPTEGVPLVPPSSRQRDVPQVVFDLRAPEDRLEEEFLAAGMDPETMVWDPDEVAARAAEISILGAELDAVSAAPAGLLGTMEPVTSLTPEDEAAARKLMFDARTRAEEKAEMREQFAQWNGVEADVVVPASEPVQKPAAPDTWEADQQHAMARLGGVQEVADREGWEAEPEVPEVMEDTLQRWQTAAALAKDPDAQLQKELQETERRRQARKAQQEQENDAQQQDRGQELQL